MPDPLLYLQAMGAAAVISALVVLIIAWFRPIALARRTPQLCILGIGLGMMTGYGMLSFPWDWPPSNALNRFLLIVIPAVCVLESLAGDSPVAIRVTWIARIVLAMLAPRILLHGSVYLKEWNVGQSWIMLGACGSMLSGVWILLSRYTARSPGISLPIGLALSVQSAGLAVMLAGYIKGGVAAIPIAATLWGTAFALWMVRSASVDSVRGATRVLVGIGVVGLFGILVVGEYFGRLPSSSAFVILVSPLMCWITELPGLRRMRPHLKGMLAVLLITIPLLMVLFVAKREFDRTMAPLLGRYLPPGSLRQETLS